MIVRDVVLELFRLNLFWVSHGGNTRGVRLKANVMAGWN